LFVQSSTHSSRDALDRPAHVATRTFQALRIFVNDELNELYNGLEAAYALLRPCGLCAAVTFHSLEDRVVKRHFQGQDMDERANMSVTDRHRNPSVLHSADDLNALLRKRWRPAWKGARVPADEEVLHNPRSRSAKFRAAWKL
jgi:16S rRNA C1402 N4-methylase RsmH